MMHDADTQSLDNVRVQHDDFDMALEYQHLCDPHTNAGAVVVFSGLVREFSTDRQIRGLFLEHYPGMTEQALRDIVTQARAKWPLAKVSVIHRVGHLKAHEQIVMVGVSSQHREAAFSAAAFIMDYLKINAPFWKKELTSEGDFWVEAKASDQQAATKW